MFQTVKMWYAYSQKIIFFHVCVLTYGSFTSHIGSTPTLYVLTNCINVVLFSLIQTVVLIQGVKIQVSSCNLVTLKSKQLIDVLRTDPCHKNAYC